MVAGGKMKWSGPPDHITPMLRTATPTNTFTNPLDLDYRFQLSLPSRREAADPTMVVYQRTYYLFASKSGGYWRSKNLLDWVLVEPTGLPLEDYAPTVMVWRDKMWFTAYDTRAVFTTDDPDAGVWRQAATLSAYGDPCLFLDEGDGSDGSVYMAHGCSATVPTSVVRLDTTSNATHWGEASATVDGASGNFTLHGWEERGDDNTGDPLEPGQLSPSVEGSWLTKRGGAYYLQYAAPGTQYKSYGDGIFTAAHPLGPYTRVAASPFSHKPTGFSAGAGHGSTFQDLSGRWWHIATSTISVRHKFERRLSLLPVAFGPVETRSAGGTRAGRLTQPPPSMTADAVLGDYPTTLDGKRPWQLLSCFAGARASSSLDEAHAPHHATDEDIRTWWSAVTGSAGEWLEVALTRRATVHALQLNFADEGSNATGRPSREESFRYIVEGSDDAHDDDTHDRGGGSATRRSSRRGGWTLLLNRSAGGGGRYSRPHQYSELPSPRPWRTLRLTAVGVAPAHAKWSLSGFRAFGLATDAAPPSAVAAVSATRDKRDRRHALITWPASEGAQFYLLRYGALAAPPGAAGAAGGGPLLLQQPRPHAFQVYSANATLAYPLHALSVDQRYSVAVDAVNEAGVTAGTASAVVV